MTGTLDKPALEGRDRGAAPVASLFGIIACISTVGLTYSLSMPLLGLLLEAQGTPGWLIGANAAVTGVATISLAPLVPRLMRRLGVLPFLIGCTTLTAVSIVLFPLLPSLWVWFALRFILGAAVTGLFIGSEAWISYLAGESRRGRVMGFYASALAIGYTAGPALLMLTGVQGIAPFAAAAAITLAAALPLALARGDLPPFHDEGEARLIDIARSAPTAVVGVLLFGAIEAGILTLLPVWGVQNGLDALSAAQLMMWIGAGNVALQIPIGWLADKMDRRIVLVGCAAAGVVGAGAMPLLVGTAWLGPALFVLGGALMGLYTVGLALLGQRFGGSDLATANAVYIIFYGIGSMTGPPLGGSALDLAPGQGLPIVMGLGCAAFIAYALRRRAREG
ncbi:MFS transporter [Oleomonas cavernae]|uniref:MFS transporter n=1 Tax=Oleomonas cavernae TaxID=2320859 RepID=A0A418WB24_9PROT|nr:MFS transporter [Oleomonas cavernae]RJF87210.1 MFS transporter [Oleomonas cavernae]